MNKGETKTILRNIWKWFMRKRLIILSIILGYISTQIFDDGEFFGTTLVLGTLLLLAKEDEV